MLTVWEERGIEKGIQQGAILSMRRTILRQMNVRFGVIPPGVVARVESIASQAELEDLLDRVVAAPTLEAMGLNQPTG